MPSRSRQTYLRAVAVGLGAGAMTFVAVGWVAGLVVNLAVGAVHPEWLSPRGPTPGWFDALSAVLGVLGLSLSAYVGWRTGRDALQSGRGLSGMGRNLLAIHGVLLAGLGVLLIAVFGFHAPLTGSFLVIMGPTLVAVMVVVMITGMRARPTPPTRRDWLNAGVLMLLLVAALGLFAAGVLTGHLALTITVFCVLLVVMAAAGVVVIIVKARRETQDSDHTH